MDFHTDYTVKLTTNTEYENLYKWCIQEFDAGGKQVGRDLIPWTWSLEFRVSNLRYFFNLSSEDRYRYSSPDDDEAEEDIESAEQDQEFETSEVICADLTPSDGGGYQPTTYSMVGTSRSIKVIQLRIAKSEEDSCQLWGSVSYTTEIDFRDETTDDA